MSRRLICVGNKHRCVVKQLCAVHTSVMARILNRSLIINNCPDFIFFFRTHCLYELLFRGTYCTVRIFLTCKFTYNSRKFFFRTFYCGKHNTREKQHRDRWLQIINSSINKHAIKNYSFFAENLLFCSLFLKKCLSRILYYF